ncbi:lysophospholipid acyltransferase family protein [Mucilaginibacter sp. UR6-11]|uniref:lysophospholipid acyltransferase family protein n=1 Tax=Mucilaginibacter sp. UR6-11 TaxID=1435644 RepID=UPI001E28797B|nr:lysophospholipid acyltransferase family protein [Mucilaginibacter sp. UR6-11]MCC8426758.1 lysophospholipid acyltransferase family protein [Mucilaginibacter sp. UR6-11]
MINKGLSRLGIFFLYLISLLPFWLLYLVSDGLFVVLFYVIRYRRKVVQENLRNAFPEKSAAEWAAIEKKYFKYLADLIIETIKMISISKEEMQRRVVVTNPEVVKNYEAKGKSVTAVAGHYCNWEWAGMEFSIHTRLFVIYKPLTSSVFDEFFVKVRTRFGAVAVAMKQTLRTMVAHKNEFTVTVFAGDQTPVREQTNYFTDFLNQPTAVFLGIEKIAKMIDSAVIFYDMRRVKRGYYTYTIVPLVENSKDSAPYEITEAHVKYLDAMIKREPQYWLWSHRRWKFKPEPEV